MGGEKQCERYGRPERVGGVGGRGEGESRLGAQKGCWEEFSLHLSSG